MKRTNSNIPIPKIDGKAGEDFPAEREIHHQEDYAESKLIREEKI